MLRIVEVDGFDMFGLHALTTDEVAWLGRMGQGRLKKSEAELGIPVAVRDALIVKDLVYGDENGLLQITANGMAELIRITGSIPSSTEAPDRNSELP